MPTMSSSRVKPLETPWTALAASARVKPCSAACCSEARFNSSLPSACSMVMPCGMGTVSLPFGPVTSSCSPICTFTPLGSGIGFFPILDIISPNPAQNFAAHVLFVSVAPGHYPARRRQDVDPHAAQHAGYVGLADIHPAARTRDALDSRDHRRIIVSVFQ